MSIATLIDRNTMSVEERNALYMTRGRSIRSTFIQPPYARREPNGSINDTLGTWQDPIYYLPVDSPLRGALLDDGSLNIRMGILGEAARLHGRPDDIPWYDIDWECVPMLSESIEQAYLAAARGDVNQYTWLLSRYASYDKTLNSYTLPYIATLYQSATYTLPNLVMSYKGSMEATIPKSRDLLHQWASFTLDQDGQYVTRTVYDYFGVEAMTDGKSPFLNLGDSTSFPDLLTNEVLRCREKNPLHPEVEIGRTLGVDVLHVYAKVLEDMGYSQMSEQFMDEAEHPTLHGLKTVVDDGLGLPRLD